MITFSEHLPPTSGAVGADPMEAAGEIPTVGYSIHRGQGGAGGGDAGVDAHLRRVPVTVLACLQGRPERAGNSASRAQAVEHRAVSIQSGGCGRSGGWS